MSLLYFFLSRKNNTAYIAKERLKIIFQKKIKNVIYPEYFLKLKKDVLCVIDKYMKMQPNVITVRINEKNSNNFILELNMLSQS